jgi:hypothetical protein
MLHKTAQFGAKLGDWAWKYTPKMENGIKPE